MTTKTSKQGNTMKLTRQGVRDLSHIKGKSVGKKLDLPPDDHMNCEHTHTRTMEHALAGRLTVCTRCKCMWDEEGIPV